MQKTVLKNHKVKVLDHNKETSSFMKNKLLFWVGDDLLNYCLVNSLQKKYDADYFAITETHTNVKNFLDEQAFLQFNKIWHMLEHISLQNREPDIEFLTTFEKKYNLVQYHPLKLY